MKNSDVAVFLGPSLARADAEPRLPGARFLPPVRQGDVLRAMSEGARTLVLIDGVFEQSPAVWHKEILAALAQGIRVIGASSMGALRAAELDRFGMEGIGWVYRQYAGGLADDDEVALLHADEELAWANLSVPMIQFRHLLASSEPGEWLHQALGPLIPTIKARFYAGRDAGWLQTLFSDSGYSQELVARLIERLVSPAYSIKRSDALDALEAASRGREAAVPALPRTSTVFLQRLARSVAPGSQPELRQRLNQAQALAALVPTSDADTQTAQILLGQWQRSKGLASRRAVEQYLAQRGICRSDFFAFFKAHAQLQTLARSATAAQRERARAFFELI